MGFLTTLPRKTRSELAVAGSGLISESFSRLFVAGQTAPATQQIYTAPVGLRAGDLATNCHCDVTVLGTSTAPTLIKMALLDKTGKVLGQSANLAADTMWTTTLGPKTVALAAAVTIPTDDLYYVSFLRNGIFAGTDMQLGRANAQIVSVGNALGAGVALWPGQTGQTDYAATNASQTLTQSVAGTVIMWFGVS